MVKKTDRKFERTRRHIRVRRKISGTAEKQSAGQWYTAAFTGKTGILSGNGRQRPGRRTKFAATGSGKGGNTLGCILAVLLQKTVQNPLLYGQ